MENIDFSEEINKKIEVIKDEVLSGKINLLDFELNPIFSDIKDSLSIFNIENYSESYKNACELLSRKFEELRNLLSSLDIEKKFLDFLKENPEEKEITEIFDGCWNYPFELDARLMDLKIEHLNKEKSDYQFLLEIPRLKFTDKLNAFFNKIRTKLPCYFEDVFENKLDQIKIYEEFVYLLHLLQLGKIKYQKDTNTLYV